MVRFARILFLLVPIAFALACDPTQSDKIAALGDEAPGVRRGPTHRPGQPCLLCHDGALGDPQEFSVAGTVYQQVGSSAAVDGAQVLLTDAKGSSVTATTNTAGNFYLTPSDWSPTFPIAAQVVSGSTHVSMRTLISRDGSCGGCHVDPPGDSSPGRVALVLEDGGAPP